jgi:hypothetical protein
MDQEYLAVSAGGFGDDIIVGHHDFEGVGLTVAAEGIQRVWGGMSAFLKVRGSLLYGDSLFFATDGTVDDVLIRTNDQDLISVGETQIGVDWRTTTGGGNIFFITTAIEAQYWANAGTALPGRVGTDDGNYVDSYPADADMGFLGVNGSVGFIY